LGGVGGGGGGGGLGGGRIFFFWGGVEKTYKFITPAPGAAPRGGVGTVGFLSGGPQGNNVRRG